MIRKTVIIGLIRKTIMVKLITKTIMITLIKKTRSVTYIKYWSTEGINGPKEALGNGLFVSVNSPSDAADIL